jgi:hypothetical protein
MFVTHPARITSNNPNFINQETIMAMQELNQVEMAEVSGAILGNIGGSGLSGILGNLPVVLNGAPFFLLNLLGLRNDGATLQNNYGLFS